MSRTFALLEGCRGKQVLDGHRQTCLDHLKGISPVDEEAATYARAMIRDLEQYIHEKKKRISIYNAAENEPCELIIRNTVTEGCTAIDEDDIEKAFFVPGPISLILSE